MASLEFEHSIAVTDKGEALSWGDGDSGRLGPGHELSILGFQKSSSEYTPRLIKELEGVKVKNVSAGMLHSACICENGYLYFFGERELGKWGLGKTKSATTPSTISPLPLSGKVACGGYHTCVITNGGDLYTWGSIENGCLGIGCTDVTYSPERVQGPFLKQPATQEARFTHGAGEVQMEHLKKMDILLAESWVMVTTLTTSSLLCSTFTRM